jgi:hypothetical protein
MQVYVQAGQHNAALQQYQTCETILRKELGLDPQFETRALYKQIRKGEIKQAQVIEQNITDTPSHNLPLQLTTFIGREKEHNEVIQLLKKNRLVTLTGVGGIGKTRLSLQVGEKLLHPYPDVRQLRTFITYLRPTGGGLPQKLSTSKDPCHQSRDAGCNRRSELYSSVSFYP